MGQPILPVQPEARFYFHSFETLRHIMLWCFFMLFFQNIRLYKFHPYTRLELSDKALRKS
ncbi:hypothetical protein BBD42_13345 [Paenibacillus sp. BIHB 4019]|uniref:Uncharacterized protein n=1 Tax=Paenibacillus sp. BIHB 4019 TaxID=1870819 RepID=A0A1B2DHZ8_9BACL|nr:hypothetical protein BBD42_13345 [Paenibacillus sp. BIHB 4019]